MVRRKLSLTIALSACLLSSCAPEDFGETRRITKNKSIDSIELKVNTGFMPNCIDDITTLSFVERNVRIKYRSEGCSTNVTKLYVNGKPYDITSASRKTKSIANNNYDKLLDMFKRERDYI